jgi:hypothetical protein
MIALRPVPASWKIMRDEGKPGHNRAGLKYQDRKRSYGFLCNLIRKSSVILNKMAAVIIERLGYFLSYYKTRAASRWTSVPDTGKICDVMYRCKTFLPLH